MLIQNQPWHFVLELYSFTESVVDIKDGALVRTFRLAFLNGEGDIDLPPSVTRRTGIIRDKRRTALGKYWPGSQPGKY
jgi:hypothetical protein